MSIKIIDEGPELVLTQAEYDRLFCEYQRSMMHYAGPYIGFETWVRQRQGQTTNEVKP